MIIRKILNNNVIVIEEGGQEKIAMGRGIAFKKKTGSYVNSSSIDKIFVLNNSDTNSKMKELLSYIPIEYIELVDEVVTYIQTKIDVKLKESFYISLADHIYSSIQRHEEGFDIKNPLLWDIRRSYKDEYQIALKIMDLVKEKMDVSLPEDEAASIALHIVNAQLEKDPTRDINNMYLITQIMHEITNIIKYYFKVNLDEESVSYYRFIMHLKFFAQRLVMHENNPNEADFDLVSTVQKKYKNEYACALRIQNFIQHQYHYRLSDDEMMYLTIHIAKIVNI